MQSPGQNDSLIDCIAKFANLESGQLPQFHLFRVLHANSRTFFYLHS